MENTRSDSHGQILIDDAIEQHAKYQWTIGRDYFTETEIDEYTEKYIKARSELEEYILELERKVNASN